MDCDFIGTYFSMCGTAYVDGMLNKRWGYANVSRFLSLRLFPIGRSMSVPHPIEETSKRVDHRRYSCE